MQMDQTVSILEPIEPNARPGDQRVTAQLVMFDFESAERLVFTYPLVSTCRKFKVVSVWISGSIQFIGGCGFIKEQLSDLCTIHA